ncbi:LTA synthase family protein [Reinekea sp.]|uniref:LTA synthase family protein n=4 Tax=Reinekea sp. TaxID=1970455 RepID=UPI003989DA29
MYSLSKYPFLALRLITLFVIYTTCRIIFFVYNIEFFPNTDIDALGYMLFGGMRFDLTAILYTNGLYLLAVAIPFPFRLEYTKYYQWFWNLYYLVINTIAIAVNFIDTIYYQYTLHRSTFMVISEFENESNVGGIIFSGLFDFWPLTLAFLLVMGLFVFLFRLIKLAPSNMGSVAFYSIYLLLVIPLLYFSIIGIRGGFGSHTRPIAMNNAGEYVTRASQMSIVLNTPFTLIRTIKKKAFTRYSFFETESELKQVFDPEHPKRFTQEAQLDTNVVILIMESFGAEVSGFLNKELDNGTYEGLVPFLDTLMADSLTFEYGFAHGRKSIDAIPAIVSGIPSMIVPYVISNYGTNKINGLGSILDSQGYYTAFFHGAPNGSMGFNSIMNLAGFRSYFGMSEFKQAGLYNENSYDGTWGIWDDEFMQYMASTINELPQPFATTFFSLSSHHPNVIPEQFENKFKEGDTIGNYTFQYADYALKHFFEVASKMPWYDNTLFVIVADHATTNYHSEYKSDFGRYRIPIVFYKPDGSLRKLSQTVAQQSDIFPTVLDILNIDEEYFSYGNSLIDSDSPKFAVTYVNNNYQLVMGDWVMQYDGEVVNSFYNYKKDIELTTNLVESTEPAVLQDLEKMTVFLKAYLQQYNNRMIEDRLVLDN